MRRTRQGYSRTSGSSGPQHAADVAEHLIHGGAQLAEIASAHAIQALPDAAIDLAVQLAEVLPWHEPRRLRARLFPRPRDPLGSNLTPQLFAIYHGDSMRTACAAASVNENAGLGENVQIRERRDTPTIG